MLSVQNSAAAANTYMPPAAQTEKTPDQAPAAKAPVPSVAVSSASDSAFSALADLIFKAASASGSDANPAATVTAKNDSDSDDGAGGPKVNDHDADDMGSAPTPNMSESGAYDFGGATA
jgi:hypothetical protein